MLFNQHIQLHYSGGIRSTRSFLACQPYKHWLCNFCNTHVYTGHQLSPDNVGISIGTVQAIDTVKRCFCIPVQDCILTCPPAYGMYLVSAQVNDVGVVDVPLLSPPTFALDFPAIDLAFSSDASIKLAYIASPGNPQWLSGLKIRRRTYPRPLYLEWCCRP
jgi:DNA-binding transcriptional MocR family regulator